MSGSTTTGSPARATSPEVPNSSAKSHVRYGRTRMWPAPWRRRRDVALAYKPLALVREQPQKTLDFLDLYGTSAHTGIFASSRDRPGSRGAVAAMVMLNIRFPDPEFAEAFRAYVNYFEDLAGSIGGEYGTGGTLVEGVHDGVLAHPPVARIRRKPLSPAERDAVDKALRKAWASTQRVSAEVEDPSTFDEEANAWIPMQSYYGVYWAVIAYAVASGNQVPRDHRAALNFAGRQVTRGLFPYPWCASCSNGPDTADITYDGFPVPLGPVHVLSSPDPWTTEDRLAMFLRTTRQKELERRFAKERTKKRAPGRSRRNLSKAEKGRLAAAMGPTTVFDILWRLRKKANYDDADVFVLGAASELDARRLGAGLAFVMDATVAALEALIVAYVGADELVTMADRYRRKKHANPQSALSLRVASWGRYGTVMTVP